MSVTVSIVLSCSYLELFMTSFDYYVLSNDVAW